jgi:DNA-binding transcriptional LysR family regulator
METGSFTAAADKLGITKSYASKLVSRLEDRLGVRLLNRSTRKLTVTEAGKAYHDHCVAVLAALEQAEMAATELQMKPRGRLRLAVPTFFGSRYLLGPIASFKTRYPELTLEVNFADRRIDLSAEGFDLAIRAGLLHEDKSTARRLATAPMFPCASREYLDKHGWPREPEDLVKHECLIYAYEALPDTWAMTDGQREVAVTVSGTLGANYAQMLIEAAVAGLGICFLPLFHTYSYLREGKLVRVLPQWQRPDLVPINAIYPTTRHVPAKTRAFIDHVVEHFRIPVWSRE